MEQQIRKFRDKNKYDLSCSETMIYAANEKYNLGLNESHFHMMAPFSGGMYERQSCGILTGAIAVLGILFTDHVSHNSPLLNDAVIEYKTLFRERFGSQICDSLVLSHQDEITGCDNLIIQGGKLLEEVIMKYGKV